MGLFSAGRGPRKYGYEPRRYDPSDDESIRRRMRVRRRGGKRRSPMALLYLLGLLVVCLFIYFSL